MVCRRSPSARTEAPAVSIVGSRQVGGFGASAPAIRSFSGVRILAPVFEHAQAGCSGRPAAIVFRRDRHSEGWSAWFHETFRVNLSAMAGGPALSGSEVAVECRSGKSWAPASVRFRRRRRSPTSCSQTSSVAPSSMSNPAGSFDRSMNGWWRSCSPARHWSAEVCRPASRRRRGSCGSGLSSWVHLEVLVCPRHDSARDAPGGGAFC